MLLFSRPWIMTAFCAEPLQLQGETMMLCMYCSIIAMIFKCIPSFLGNPCMFSVQLCYSYFGLLAWQDAFKNYIVNKVLKRTI